MYPTYDKPAPGIFERAQDMLDGFLSSAAFDVTMTVVMLSILLCMFLAIIGGGIYSLAAYFLRSHPQDPYGNVRGMPFDFRVSAAHRVICACLPDSLTRDGVARAVYEINYARVPRVTVRTQDGSEVILPGEVIAVVQRILSPDMTPEAYGVFEAVVEGGERIEHGLHYPTRFGPNVLDDMDARYDLVAGAGSMLERRREERKRSRSTTDTAIIAANAAMMNSSR